MILTVGLLGCLGLGLPVLKKKWSLGSLKVGSCSNTPGDGQKWDGREETRLQTQLEMDRQHAEKLKLEGGQGRAEGRGLPCRSPPPPPAKMRAQLGMGRWTRIKMHVKDV